MALGMDNVRAHEQELTRYAMEDAAPRGPRDRDLRAGRGRARRRRAFNLPGIHPHDVAQILDRSGICVRAGHHCTMPLHERFDLAATARASFNVYTIPEEIDALAVGLREVQRIFDAPGRPGILDPDGRSLPRLHPGALPAAA
jgi:cysteine desulfurase/selenocysteine lyase